MPSDRADEASAALREIVFEYGPEALSRPAVIANVLKDLLPDSPAMARIIISAAEDRVADVLRDHVAQGLDVATAVRLTAAAFASATMLTPEACAWVVGAIAAALGLVSHPPTLVVTAQPVSPLRESASAPPEPAGNHSVTVAARTGPMAYVTAFGDNAIVPIDLSRRAAGAAIKAGRQPKGLAIAPDRAMAYVANYADGTVTPIWLDSGSPGRRIPVGESPVAISVAPGDAVAYVANSGDGTITRIDLADGSASASIRTGGTPFDIAVTPDGGTAYVVNAADGTVVPVDLVTGIVSTPIKVGPMPIAIAIAPDGATAYVVNSGDATVTPFSTSTRVCDAPAKVAKYPVAIAVSPDGTTAYVASASGIITPIGKAAGKPIRVGGKVTAIKITPDGSSAYLACSDHGTIIAVDLRTNSPGAPIAAGRQPCAIAIR